MCPWHNCCPCTLTMFFCVDDRVVVCRASCHVGVSVSHVVHRTRGTRCVQWSDKVCVHMCVQLVQDGTHVRKRINVCVTHVGAPYTLVVVTFHCPAFHQQ